jgi:hypothetical protein
MDIQVGQQSKVKVLAKRSSQQIYNIIPKSQKWLSSNVVDNIVEGFFYQDFTFLEVKELRTITSKIVNLEHV